MPSARTLAVATTCPYCGVGCGVLATPDGAGGADVTGDPTHPANFGRLCSKGAALGETLGLASRQLHPLVHGARATWDAALDRVAEGLREATTQYGPESVAFYLSGQLLTEDYYVANKLAKGFIGTPHVDTNSRLCMASSVAGHRRAFGADTVPGCYEDLDTADLLVLVGSNAAWCHPVLFRRMEANRAARGAKIVVIDPRRTNTADEADLFLPVASGGDVALFSGLLTFLAKSGDFDDAYVAHHTTGLDAALARARHIAPDVETAARETGLEAAALDQFYRLWAGTPKVVTVFSQGVNQSVQGTDKVNAIINCHLATGRIGREGMGPFSLTGQPNAMGGREVGGLANMLAAHMGFSAPERERVARFWTAPNLVSGEGHKAVAMFEAIERGEVRALWIMGTNPLVSMPDADRARAALAKLDLLVVSDVVARTDTLGAAPHVVLPATGWGEKDGTVTNSERRISRQRAFLPPPGEARPDWWALAEVAKRLGFGDAFSWRGSAGIFREHAALSAFENGGARDFDLGALATLTDAAYDGLAPVQWPARPGATPPARMFADGRFFTPDARARFVAVEIPAKAQDVSETFPLVLNTGRIRDQWHTMTRTGLSPRLGAHLPAPFVAVHPDDALRLGLVQGGLARLSTAHGEATLEVDVTDAQTPGSVFAPIHWSGETATAARVGALVHSRVDPVSGQPDLKATPASLAPVTARVQGFVIATDPPDMRAHLALGWWSRVALEGATGFLFASNEELRVVASEADAMFPGAELVEYADDAGGQYRCAVYRNSMLTAVLFAARDERPNWDAARALFKPGGAAVARHAPLSGAAEDGTNAAGPLVCACFGVGLETIRDCVRAGAHSTEAIGAAVRAGTNCGSCAPEIRRVLAAEIAPA